jgi:hypothetical protein
MHTQGRITFIWSDMVGSNLASKQIESKIVIRGLGTGRRIVNCHKSLPNKTLSLHLPACFAFISLHNQMGLEWKSPFTLT